MRTYLPRPRLQLLPLLCCLLFAPSAHAQSRVLAEFPIELSHGKTIVPVTVGGASLRMILDSGMDYDGVLVFDSAKVDLRQFANLLPAQIGGAGSGGAAGALFDSAGSFTVGGRRFADQRVIILTSDIYRGFPNDGVIGYSLLGHYAVELDYDRNRMVLYEPTAFSPAPGWIPVNLYFRENRVPWLDVQVATTNEAPVTLHTYIDFASSEALELLDGNANRYRMPAVTRERIVGRGLSGDIYGKYGQVAKVSLGPFVLQNVSVVVVPASARSKQPSRADAIVAGDLLRRFNIVFDYSHSRLYLKPNRYFEESRVR